MKMMPRTARPDARNLLAFPAQCNISGVQHRLDVVDEAHAEGLDGVRSKSLPDASDVSHL